MRWVAICFRGDEADHWQDFATLELADAACAGISLVDIDDRNGWVYDLDRPGLLYDAEENPPEEMANKEVSAHAAMHWSRIAWKDRQR